MSLNAYYYAHFKDLITPYCHMVVLFLKIYFMYMCKYQMYICALCVHAEAQGD